jgi:hypothetical protein
VSLTANVSNCDLGPECRFIHAVFIDPNAPNHKRAPPPQQLQRWEQRKAPTAILTACEAANEVLLTTSFSDNLADLQYPAISVTFAGASSRSSSTRPTTAEGEDMLSASRGHFLNVPGHAPDTPDSVSLSMPPTPPMYGIVTRKRHDSTSSLGSSMTIRGRPVAFLPGRLSLTPAHLSPARSPPNGSFASSSSVAEFFDTVHTTSTSTSAVDSALCNKRWRYRRDPYSPLGQSVTVLFEQP